MRSFHKAYKYDLPISAEDARKKGPQFVRVHEFTHEAVTKFRDAIEAALDAEQPVIPVAIDSFGGQVYALLAMIDIIESAKKSAIVPTIAEGKAMSCGAVLLSCGTEGHRYVAPSATVMIHDVSSMVWGKTHDLIVDAEESKRLNDLLYRKMAENTGHDDPDYFYAIVHEKGRADWYLTPQECRRHNLANKVKLPRLDVSVNVKVKFG